MIDSALAAARLFLALVLGVAAVAKLADPTGTAAAIAEFGLPGRLGRPGAVLLPLGELAAAVLLIPSQTARWGAAAAVGLMALFCIGIGVNLARGRRPDCHCFGQVRSAPVGWMTLARNGALAALAVAPWAAGPGSAVWPRHVSQGGWPMTVVLAVLVVMVLVEGALLLKLFAAYGGVLRRLDGLAAGPATGGTPVALPAYGLPVGAVAPDFSLPGLHGETLTLSALRAAARPVLLVFTDPGCGPCAALLPELGRWQADHAGGLTIALLSRGTVEANLAKTGEHGIINVLLQKDREVADAYRYGGTPSAVIVNSDGLIDSPLVSGPDPIRALVTARVGQAGVPSHVPVAMGPAAPRSRIGQPAPPVRMADLDGNIQDLADLRGQPTLLLFWNPGCGFCQQILVDVKRLEASSRTPSMLFVSAGPVEANREMGLRSPVLLEDSFSIGPQFGASGTPSAILVDAEGRIASELAVGGPAVLGLAAADKLSGR